jgi:hypothetical protein
MPEDPGGGVPVTQDEMISLMYTPCHGEWPACGRDPECDRIIHGTLNTNKSNEINNKPIINWWSAILVK